MPSPNEEVVRRLFDVYNDRTFEANADLIDPDIVWDVSRMELPDSSAYEGREELGGFVEAWAEGFEGERVEAEEVIDAGDRVITMVRHTGRGKLSRAEVVQRFAMVWTLRDGRAVRMDMYLDREEALAAVGLVDSP